MTLMLTVARAVMLLVGWTAGAPAGAGGAGSEWGETLAASRISGPIIRDTIMQCDPDGYQPVYYCSEMGRSPRPPMAVASGGALC